MRKGKFAMKLISLLAACCLFVLECAGAVTVYADTTGGTYQSGNFTTEKEEVRVIGQESEVVTGSALQSPVVSGSAVTFYYKGTDEKQVLVAGSFTEWQNGALEMTKGEDGIWTCLITLSPGVYEYKFIADGNWLKDANNPNERNGNSCFYVDGLTISSRVEVARGSSVNLPQTALFYQEGEAKEAAILSYKAADDSEKVTIQDYTLTVASDYEGSTVTLLAYTEDASCDFTVSVLDQLYTYHYYYYHSDEFYSDKDLWIWGDGINGSANLFTDTFKDEYGRTWAEGTLEYSLSTISIIARTTDESHDPGVWNGQEPERSFSLPEGTTEGEIWIVSGDSAVYSFMPEPVSETLQRGILIRYLREDTAYTDWNIYTWTDGTRVVDFDENGYAYVTVSEATTQLDFLIRKGYPQDGEAWVKDGGDLAIQIPTNQQVVKAVITSGNTANMELLPYNTGYEANVNENVVYFYYRNDEKFKEGTLDKLYQVQVAIDNVRYDMTYNPKTERYEYAYQNVENGTHFYCYYVTEEAGGEEIPILDLFNENTENGLSVMEYYKLNAVAEAKVSPSSITYTQNAVLSIEASYEENDQTLQPSAAYVDLTSLGGEKKVAVETELMEFTISVADAVEPGKKEIPVTVVDQYGQAFTTTAEVTVNDTKTAEFSFDEAVIYFIVTDRFFDGNAENNDAYGVGDYDTNSETGYSSYHGGDFAGVTAKLDYLKDLGINTIWISPIVENILESQTDSNTGIKTYGYHGYWASNFETLNAHFGTEEELRTLITEAHKRGIKIMVDVVINHAGYGTEDVFEGMFRDHNVPGSTILDSLSGLPDFATEIPEVRNKLIEWQTAWMTEYGIDYFRVDTVKHVETTTWAAFKNALTKINPEFKLIGEYSGAGASNDFDYLFTGRMDSLLNFDFNDLASRFVMGELEEVEASLEATDQNLNSAATVGNFLSSHDEDGLLATLLKTENQEDAFDMMKLAASLQVTAKGQPVIYYGEEVGQTGLNNWPYQTNRYDFDWNLVTDENEMYVHYKKLLAIRNAYSDVFSKGSRTQITASNEAGYLVVERAYTDQKVLLGFNDQKKATQVTFTLDGISGYVLRDIYNNLTYAPAENGQITVTIPSIEEGGTAVFVYEKSSDDTGNNSGSQGSTGSVSEKISLSSDNWEKVKEEILTVSAKAGLEALETPEEILVDVKKETKVPTEVLSRISGKNIRLVLVMGDFTWKIDGTDMTPELWESVTKQTSGIDISVTVIEGVFEDEKLSQRLDAMLIDKSYSVKGIESFIIGNGSEFPFKASLTIKTEKEWRYHYLYATLYDQASYKLTPVSYGQAREHDTVTFEISQGGTYLITNANPVRPFIGKYLSIQKGEQINMADKIQNLIGGERIYYSSSNPDVAVVEKDGNVKVMKKGSTTITIKIVQGSRCFVYETALITEDTLSYTN